MTCKPVLVGATPVPAHEIADRNYAHVTPLARACGGLVLYDQENDQALVVPPMPPSWESIPQLVSANKRWAPEFKMFQARFDYIWITSLRWDIDPRQMIAILLQEGTGSFNTNPGNAAEYNGNGPDSDWIRDTERACHLIHGKLAWYGRAVECGFREEAAKLGYTGSAIQFCNWPGPILNGLPSWGCYAQHADWWMNVERFYEELGGRVSVLNHYWLGQDKPDAILRCEAVTDQPKLCSDLSGLNPRPGVVTWYLG